MGSSVLGEAITAVRAWSMKEDSEPTHGVRATEVFGSLVFSDEVQQARLPKAAYQALRRTITHGDPLDPTVADEAMNYLVGYLQRLEGEPLRRVKEDFATLAGFAKSDGWPKQQVRFLQEFLKENGIGS